MAKNVANKYQSMTDAELRAVLVNLLVAKWGEAEREASERMVEWYSRGLVANRIAYFDLDHVDADAKKEAARTLTAADRKALRQGG